MKVTKRGFTMLEIMFFIALSGLLVAGIIAGTHGAIQQQRYNDTIQSFAEFLRSVYSSVGDPQGIKNGRSDYAVYGKLVTFGEEYDTEGNKNTSNKIFTYDIIGNADELSTSNVLASLRAADAHVLNSDGAGGQIYAGYASSYIPQWDAKVQVPTSDNDFKGALMIVRSPSTGTLYTFSTSTIIQVNKSVWVPGSPKNPLQDAMVTFVDDDVDFCIATDDTTFYNGRRRNIHLDKGSHDASAVEIISLDSAKNKCKKLD